LQAAGALAEATKAPGMPSATTARRAPRTAHRAPPTIHWHRVGRLALLFVLGVILLLYIRPVSHWIQQRSTAAHSRQDVQQLKKENERLQRRLKALSGPGAIERNARSMGMVKRGERAYVIEGR
jgi:cell division protein FtsB